MEEAASAGVRVAKRRGPLAAALLLAVAGSAALAAPVMHQVGGPRAPLAPVKIVARSVPRSPASPA